MNTQLTNTLDETKTTTTLSEVATEATRAGGIVPISPGFDPQPNAIYTPYSIARYLHISETAARAYFRSLDIPLLFGAGYLGSDIIGATEALKNGTMTVKPAKRGRQEIPISNAPKYITRPHDSEHRTAPFAKITPLDELKKRLKCKPVTSKTRSCSAVIINPKETINDD